MCLYENVRFKIDERKCASWFRLNSGLYGNNFSEIIENSNEIVQCEILLIGNKYFNWTIGSEIALLRLWSPIGTQIN